ncbi:MAG: hypothetical protein IT460_11880 [Planctomycetes bacterium]|nr:hypothetical protein [Planctomycetota bacterium]
MDVSKPVRAWVADTEATFGPTFDAWFPPDFGWREFCGDVPAMAARLGEPWKASTAAAAKARLEELALAAFRGAHVAALALLAGYDEQEEPDDAVERLFAPPTAEEQDATADGIDRDLEAVESALALERAEVEPGPRALHAIRVARAVREPVRVLLAEGLAKGADAVVRLGAAPAPLAKVLSGVVSVAVALAGLRHAIVAETAAARGLAPLAFDEVALRSALGGA